MHFTWQPKSLCHHHHYCYHSDSCHYRLYHLHHHHQSETTLPQKQCAAEMIHLLFKRDPVHSTWYRILLHLLKVFHYFIEVFNHSILQGQKFRILKIMLLPSFHCLSWAWSGQAMDGWGPPSHSDPRIEWSFRTEVPKTFISCAVPQKGVYLSQNVTPWFFFIIGGRQAPSSYYCVSFKLCEFISSVRSSSGYHGLLEIQRSSSHFFRFFKFFRF